MKTSLLISLLLLQAATAPAAEKQISSPDGRLVVNICCDQGKSTEYEVFYDGRQMMTRSILGLHTSIGNYTDNLKLVNTKEGKYNAAYQGIRTIKKSDVQYDANTLVLDFVNDKANAMSITFYVSNNDIAYRYTIKRPEKSSEKKITIYDEATSFNFPDCTTTFLSPQIQPGTGWEKTKPSYEEDYTLDAPLNAKSKYGVGYTFPCLFRIGADGWVLVNETGVDGRYCGARLGDYRQGQGYTIAYPQKGENDFQGSESASISLPGSTPWRTITTGKDLKPIVETTVQYDVTEPLYEAKYDYKPTRYTWSWLIWQDNSIVYDDQVKFVDLASEMGFENCLVDGYWDKNIGHDGIERLAKYAASKNVSLMLWYNSNGTWNNAPQGPRDIMNNPIKRKKEMAWMKSIGVNGIKVDFFGGDKQATMQLYEEILSDANDYGLRVIFHGCTLPRGWERMYPNYVGSEAALASENVYFSEDYARKEPTMMTIYPFTRNAVGSFDWGGIIMNRHLSRNNKDRHRRYTSDIFEMATGITNQCSVNCVAIQPNNLTELKDFELDFLRSLPTSWDETLFIDGYPGKYIVMARRHGNQWYVAGLNATDKPMTLPLNLKMFAGAEVKYYTDAPTKKGDLFSEPMMKTAKVKKGGDVKVVIQPNGGFILKK